MEKQNFNVDSIKLSHDLKILVDGESASFINNSFEKLSLEGNN
jgi:hypothetical protein